MCDISDSIEDTDDNVSVNGVFPYALLIRQWLRSLCVGDPNKGLAASRRTTVALNSLRALVKLYKEKQTEPILRNDINSALRLQLRRERMYLQEQLFRHRYLYSILQEIRDTRPKTVANWQAFRHYNYFVFRHFLRPDPIVNTEKLSHLVLRQLYRVIEELTKEDKTQFYIRIVTLLREFIDVAVENYVTFAKSQTGDQYPSYMACLLSYYSAFISASLKLSDVLSEFSQFISERFRMNWYLFNQRIFHQHFYQRPEVQDRIPAFREMCNAEPLPGLVNLIKSYNTFVDNMNSLNEHWEIQRKRIDIINERNVLTEVEWTERDWKMFEEVHRIAKTNYWFFRSEKVKAIQDMEELDSYVLELLCSKWVTSERLITLAGTCICEDCMLGEFYQMLLPPNHRLRNNNRSAGVQQGNSALYEIPVPVKEVWSAEQERPLVRLTMCSICQETVLLDAYALHIVSKHPPTDEELLAEREAVKAAAASRKAKEAKVPEASTKRDGYLRNVADRVVDIVDTSCSDAASLENSLCLVVVEQTTADSVALPADSPHVQCVSSGTDGNRLVQIELPPSLASSVRAIHGMSRSARFIEYSLNPRRSKRTDQSHNKPFSIEPPLHSHVAPGSCSLCLRRNGGDVTILNSNASGDLHCSLCCEAREPSIISIFPKSIDNISIDSNLKPYSTLTATSSYSSSSSELDDHCYSDSSDSEVIVILKNQNDCDPFVPIKRLAHRPRPPKAPTVLDRVQCNNSWQCNGATDDNLQQSFFSPFLPVGASISPIIFDDNCVSSSSDDGPVYIDITSDEDDDPTHDRKPKSDDDLLSVEPFRPDGCWNLDYPDLELEPEPPTPFAEDNMADAEVVQVNLRGVVIIPGHEDEIKYEYSQFRRPYVSSPVEVRVCAPGVRLNVNAPAPGFWFSERLNDGTVCDEVVEDPTDDEPKSKLLEFPNRDSLLHADGLDDCGRLFQAFIRDADCANRMTETNDLVQKKNNINNIIDSDMSANQALCPNMSDIEKMQGDDSSGTSTPTDAELAVLILGRFVPFIDEDPTDERLIVEDHRELSSSDSDDTQEDVAHFARYMKLLEAVAVKLEGNPKLNAMIAAKECLEAEATATGAGDGAIQPSTSGLQSLTVTNDGSSTGESRRQVRLRRLQTIRAKNEAGRKAQKAAKDRVSMPPPPLDWNMFSEVPIQQREADIDIVPVQERFTDAIPNKVETLGNTIADETVFVTPKPPPKKRACICAPSAFADAPASDVSVHALQPLGYTDTSVVLGTIPKVSKSNRIKRILKLRPNRNRDALIQNTFSYNELEKFLVSHYHSNDRRPTQAITPPSISSQDDHDGDDGDDGAEEVAVEHSERIACVPCRPHQYISQITPQDAKAKKDAKRQRQKKKRAEEHKLREEMRHRMRERHRIILEEKRGRLENEKREQEQELRRLEERRRSDREREAAKKVAQKLAEQRELDKRLEQSRNDKARQAAKKAALKSVGKKNKKNKQAQNTTEAIQSAAKSVVSVPAKGNAAKKSANVLQLASSSGAKTQLTITERPPLDDSNSYKTDSESELDTITEVSQPIAEDIPAMIRIVRGELPSTVTISLKGVTPDEDKLLYTLVNGQAEIADPPLEPTDAANLLPMPDMSVLNDPSLTKKQRKKKTQQLNKRVAKVTAVNAETLKTTSRVVPDLTEEDPVTREAKIILAVDNNLRTVRAGGEVKSVARIKPFNHDARSYESSPSDSEVPVNLPNNIKFPPGITVTNVSPSTALSIKPRAQAVQQQQKASIATILKPSHFPSQYSATITPIPTASYVTHRNLPQDVQTTAVNQQPAPLDNVQTFYQSQTLLKLPYVPFYMNQPKTGSPIILETEKLINHGAGKKKRNKKTKKPDDTQPAILVQRKKFRRPPPPQQLPTIATDPTVVVTLENTPAYIAESKSADGQKIYTLKNPLFQQHMSAPQEFMQHPTATAALAMQPINAHTMQPLDPVQQNQLSAQLSEQATISKGENGMLTIRRPGLQPDDGTVGETMSMTDYLRNIPVHDWDAYSLFSTPPPPTTQMGPTAPTIPPEIDIVGINQADDHKAPYQADGVRSNSNYWMGMLSKLATDVKVIERPEHEYASESGITASYGGSPAGVGYLAAGHSSFCTTSPRFLAPVSVASQMLNHHVAAAVPHVTLYNSRGLGVPLNDVLPQYASDTNALAHALASMTVESPTVVANTHVELDSVPVNNPHYPPIANHGPIGPPSRTNTKRNNQILTVEPGLYDNTQQMAQSDVAQQQNQQRVWQYENVFAPKESVDGELDPEERDVEAFKRFCQQSIPPARKEKVAHLNVKEIIIKKKNRKS